MLTRRQSLSGIAALAGLAGATAAQAKDQCVAFTPQMQAAKTPEAALKRLQEGNARFVAGQALHCDFLEQVRSTAKQQAPFAAVLGCIDSRVPPELIFDQNIGDMFVGRVAGNIASTDLIGSLTGVLQQIRPSLAKLDYKGVPSSKDKALVQRVAEQNAKDAAAQLTSRSDTMAGLVRDGKLKIVYAMHDVASGKVSWFA
jgi:carbonic anhydrase